MVNIHMFMNSYHAENKISCRSRSCILIYVITTLMQWFSKKQSTVETFLFGVEFVAMKQGIDALRGLIYKLRIVGISTSGSLYLYGNNMSVEHNTSWQELVLRKKSNSVCHQIHQLLWASP